MKMWAEPLPEKAKLLDLSWWWWQRRRRRARKSCEQRQRHARESCLMPWCLEAGPISPRKHSSRVGRYPREAIFQTCKKMRHVKSSHVGHRHRENTIFPAGNWAAKQALNGYRGGGGRGRGRGGEPLKSVWCSRSHLLRHLPPAAAVNVEFQRTLGAVSVSVQLQLQVNVEWKL